ncbi:MAG: ferrous iron transport protein B [Eubacteriales bacterium]|nr:ferrous iron transport protein B [Eubacteriales bacterium]
MKSNDNKEMTVAFIGNPNCGKTTLFNAYTGANLKVANWPGVTVEKVEGSFDFKGEKINLVDLPGTYSLSSYTMEEQVSRDFILSDEVDVVIDVVDASALERNLYLALQLIELGKPVVIALNMMDIVEKRGMEIDLHRLPEMLGVPVIPISARKRKGLDILIHAAVHHNEQSVPDRILHEHPNSTVSKHRHDHHDEYVMVYSDKIEDMLDNIEDRLRASYPDEKNYRWLAIKISEYDSDILKRYPIELKDILSQSMEDVIINEKYDFIEEIIDECLVGKKKTEEWTDKADKILTHKFWSIPVFLLIMAVVFFLTFAVGDFLKGYVEVGIDYIIGATEAFLINLGASKQMISLICDGIIAGVGGVITFLPNIIILFFALAVLEDSGYMSRVAYVMDGIMGSLGLSGRAFIPMLLGFGCTVPAIMASRALESKKDRMKVMLITPFMSCSARLPIYILFSEIFFKEHAMIAAYSMYVIGIAVAILTAWIINKFGKTKSENALLIELPEYKIPSGRTVFIYVFEKIKDFLQKAGTTIFIASIIMWVLLNFGIHGYTGDMTESFGAMIGKIVVPLFKPIGLGFWQIVVALIAGISAKEVVVSSCAVLFGIQNINSELGMSMMQQALEGIGFTSLNAVSLMIFSLLYIPCAATIVTIKKESKSAGWAAFSALFQLCTAWIITFLVYQIGMIIL